MGNTVHDHLVEYSVDRRRFVGMDMSNDETGLLDLSFLPEYRAEYRDKMFTVPTVTPAHS